MAGLINWKKVAIPGTNPAADHMYVGVDSADNNFYLKDSGGTVYKFASLLALAGYDLSTVVDLKISNAISNLIDGAPVTLDTLNELAAAIADDENFATTITTMISNHISDTGNPHSVTKTQVGLSNVPNVDATQRSNHTGTQLASTISNFAATVRSTVLTGIAFGTNAAILATDTVLVAFGKLQAQINDILNRLYIDYESRTDGLINQTTTMQPYLNKNYTVPVTGNYLVELDGSWSINANDNDFEAEISVDGGAYETFIRKEAKDTGGTGPTFPVIGGGTAATGTDQLNVCSFRRVYALTAGSRNITVRFRQAVFANDEAAFHFCTVTIKKVP